MEVVPRFVETVFLPLASVVCVRTHTYTWHRRPNSDYDTESTSKSYVIFCDTCPNFITPSLPSSPMSFSVTLALTLWHRVYHPVLCHFLWHLSCRRQFNFDQMDCRKWEKDEGRCDDWPVQVKEPGVMDSILCESGRIMAVAVRAEVKGWPRRRNISISVWRSISQSLWEGTYHNLWR